MRRDGKRRGVFVTSIVTGTFPHFSRDRVMHSRMPTHVTEDAEAAPTAFEWARKCYEKNNLVRDAFIHMKLSLTLLACMTVQMYLMKSFSCKARQRAYIQNYLQTTGPIESFAAIATFILGCRRRESGILHGVVSHAGGGSGRGIRVAFEIRRSRWSRWLSVRRADRSWVIRTSSSRV